jgi:hypothetical protein
MSREAGLGTATYSDMARQLGRHKGFARQLGLGSQSLFRARQGYKSRQAGIDRARQAFRASYG